MNTLLSFQDDLSDVEIVNFVDEVDKRDMKLLSKWQWTKFMIFRPVKT